MLVFFYDELTTFRNKSYRFICNVEYENIILKYAIKIFIVLKNCKLIINTFLTLYVLNEVKSKNVQS